MTISLDVDKPTNTAASSCKESIGSLQHLEKRQLFSAKTIPVKAALSNTEKKRTMVRQ